MNENLNVYAVRTLPQKEYFAPGHRACQGCAEALAVRLQPRHHGHVQLALLQLLAVDLAGDEVLQRRTGAARPGPRCGSRWPTWARWPAPMSLCPTGSSWGIGWELKIRPDSRPSFASTNARNRSAGISIHSIGVYTNLIHPDEAERRANLAYFEAMMDAGLEYELILVDDGSSDNSYAALKRLSSKDDRVKVIRLRRNEPARQQQSDAADQDVLRSHSLILPNGSSPYSTPRAPSVMPVPADYAPDNAITARGQFRHAYLQEFGIGSIHLAVILVNYLIVRITDREL